MAGDTKLKIRARALLLELNRFFLAKLHKIPEQKNRKYQHIRKPNIQSNT